MLKSIDLWLLLPAVFLSLIGGVVLSSVAPQLYPQQFIYLGISLLAFLFFARLDVRTIHAFAPYFYILSMALLVITAFFGAFSHGAVRWISLGTFTLQPSEIAKPLTLVFFAWVLSKNEGARGFLLTLLALIPAVILILIQPDLGSSIVVLAGFLGAIFLAGIPLRTIFGALLAGGLISPLLWRFMADYQKDRILTYLSPTNDPLGSGYNSIQAKIAVGSGGLFGRGLGQGTQSQLLFLPERHTDFIFASVSEELGFLGAGLIILAFAALLYRLYKVAGRSSDTFSKAMLGGAFISIFVQCTINIGMNLGVLPITGIPLPFVSSGGSSLLAMATMLGIVSSLSLSLKNRAISSIIA